jgi:glycosyltransferase involved in cell wall biosynthesis
MSMPERIAFDARYVNDRYHGIGRYAFRLLEALVLEQERTFIVFRGQEQDTRFDWGSLAAHPNVEIWEGPWPLYWPQEQYLWPSLLRQSRADLSYSPYFVAPLLSPCPVVITIHDLIFDRYPEYMPWAWLRPYYRLLMKLSIRRAQRIISVSQATAHDLSHYYKIPPGRVTVSLEGVEPSFGTVPHEDRLRATRLHYKLERPVILSVGARRPHKNLARLVRAFASLVPHVAHDLLLVGPADNRFPDEAYKVAMEAGLNGRVRFLDWVPETDLVSLYALADLVVVPSLLEGFGLPALEAMNSGTPVLAGQTSSLPEVVGEAGVLVDPYDTEALAIGMRELLHDEARRQRLAEAGRMRAQSFTWQHVAQKVLRVYEEAVG